MSTNLAADIARATIPLGLPPPSVGAFIGAIMAHDDAALAQIEGVTPAIIGAGVQAMKGAYLKSFEKVWIAAAVISGVTALGKPLPLALNKRLTVIVSLLFINPTKEFNDHVDAALEAEPGREPK